MKRAETLWQAMVLLLVLLMTMGIYALLGWLLYGTEKGERPGRSAPASPPGPVVQIEEPLDGAILQRASELTVRSFVMEPGFVQATLRADGRLLDAQVNPQPQTAPWNVLWLWKDVGEGSHRLTVEAHGSNGAMAMSPPVTVTVVPTGNLVFSSNRNGAYALYIMRTDGSNLTRLTGGPGDARQPAPRHDGGVAFVTRNDSGQSMIWQLDAGAHESEELLPGLDPAWASDNEHLAFAKSVEGLSQLFVASAVGGAVDQVTAEKVYAGQPSWSPDGTHLAYVAEQQGNLDIWVVSADGTGSLRLTDEPAMDWAPAWSPDGTSLAFVSDRGGSHQVYVMSADGEDMRSLTDFALGCEGPAWSPDGFWLAFVAYTGSGTGVDAREVYLMRADGQNQVRLTYNSSDDTEVDWVWTP